MCVCVQCTNHCHTPPTVFYDNMLNRVFGVLLLVIIYHFHINDLFLFLEGRVNQWFQSLSLYSVFFSLLVQWLPLWVL